MNDMPFNRTWPAEGVHRVPTWIYTDQDLFDREMEHFWYGRFWNFIGLTCEVPEPGSYKRSFIAARHVVMTRGLDGTINVLENRCSHRATPVCWKAAGQARNLVCPYHQWTYDLDGKLIGVPLMRGARGAGGMPKDFDRSEHGMRQLKVVVRGASVWASFADDAPDFETYCGPTVLARLDRVFNNGRKVRLLGTSRQLLPNNWKNYAENIRDQYHATALHAFFTVFGMFRPDVPLWNTTDDEGKHVCSHSVYSASSAGGSTDAAPNLSRAITLADAEIVRPIDEFGDSTLASIFVFPSVYVQQHANMLAVRQLVPKALGETELNWTQFGYEEDDEDMRLRRMKQANLVGAAGFISGEDGDAMAQAYVGVSAYPGRKQIIEMNGRDTNFPVDGMAQEDLIRGFYKFYRREMGL